MTVSEPEQRSEEKEDASDMSMSLDGFIADPNDGVGRQTPDGRTVIVVTHSIPQGWPRPGSTVMFVTGAIEHAIEHA